MGVSGGAVYFTGMSLAHFFGLKYPLLFVYYDTPFYAYQGKIISFAVLSYVALFYLAARRCRWRWATVLGLASINVSDALAQVLAEGQSTAPYWIQMGLFAIYWLVLAGLWRRDGGKVR